MTKVMDHSEYPKSLKDKNEDSLRYIISDCKAALNAMPENPNAGYYADEICYCADELNRRRKIKSK